MVWRKLGSDGSASSSRLSSAQQRAQVPVELLEAELLAVQGFFVSGELAMGICRRTEAIAQLPDAIGVVVTRRLDAAAQGALLMALGILMAASMANTPVQH